MHSTLVTSSLLTDVHTLQSRSSGLLEIVPFLLTNTSRGAATALSKGSIFFISLHGCLSPTNVFPTWILVSSLKNELKIPCCFGPRFWTEIQLTNCFQRHGACVHVHVCISPPFWTLLLLAFGGGGRITGGEVFMNLQHSEASWPNVALHKA